MNKKVICIRIRPKCCWYEYGEISSKFFLNLEKSRAVQSTIWNITKDGRNLACHKELIKNFSYFYKDLLSDDFSVSKNKIIHF